MNQFDPYLAWLDIPPHHRPAQPWRLLRVSPQCNDPVAIRNAAQAATNRVVQAAQGQHTDWVRQLTQEIQAAEQSLLNASSGPAASPPTSGQVSAPPPPNLPPAAAPNTSGETPLRPPFRPSQPAPQRETPLSPPTTNAANAGNPPNANNLAAPSLHSPPSPRASESSGQIHAPPPPGQISSPPPAANTPNSASMLPPPSAAPGGGGTVGPPPSANTAPNSISPHPPTTPQTIVAPPQGALPNTQPSGPHPSGAYPQNTSSVGGAQAAANYPASPPAHSSIAPTPGRQVPVEAPVLAERVGPQQDQHDWEIYPTEAADGEKATHRERALSPLLIATVSISCFLFGVLLMVLFILLR